MTICAIKFCHNTSEKQKKCNNITFHRIPVDPVIADKWVKNIRLSRGEVHWKPTKNTRICSIHFNDEEKYTTQGGLYRLHRDAVPVKDLHVSCTGTDHDVINNLKVVEILPTHGQSSLSVAEDTKEKTPEILNINLATESSSQHSTSRGLSRRPSDDEFYYIFDSPLMVRLRQKLNKSSALNVKYRKIIKSLKQKNRRLQKRNKSFKRILSVLQKKRFISNDISNLL